MMVSTFYFIANLACLIALGSFALFHPHGEAVELEPWYTLVLAFVAAAGSVSLFALRLELLRPPPLIQKAGDCVLGIYAPKDDDVPRTAKVFVGRLLLWKAMWQYDSGRNKRNKRNKGEWAMTPGTDEEESTLLVPLSDLVVQERRK